MSLYEVNNNNKCLVELNNLGERTFDKLVEIAIKNGRDPPIVEMTESGNSGFECRLTYLGYSIVETGNTEFVAMEKAAKMMATFLTTPQHLQHYCLEGNNITCVMFIKPVKNVTLPIVDDGTSRPTVLDNITCGPIVNTAPELPAVCSKITDEVESKSIAINPARVNGIEVPPMSDKELVENDANEKISIRELRKFTETRSIGRLSNKDPWKSVFVDSTGNVESDKVSSNPATELFTAIKVFEDVKNKLVETISSVPVVCEESLQAKRISLVKDERQNKNRHDSGEKVLSDKVEKKSVKKRNFNARISNPIGFLQEHAMKHNLPFPNYIYVPSPRPEYIVWCNFDGDKTCGTERSKKGAKKLAALKMIANLLGENFVDSTVNENCQQEPEVKKSEELLLGFPDWQEPPRTAIKFNYVGRLQEYAVKKRVRRPNYDVVARNGQPHALIFEMKCDFNGIVVTAYGRSKKEAKQFAASKMWDILAKESPKEIST